jgi:hypothetical protein
MPKKTKRGWQHLTSSANRLYIACVIVTMLMSDLNVLSFFGECSRSNSEFYS